MEPETDVDAHRIEIRERVQDGYVISLDGEMVAYCLTRWGARRVAKRIAAKLRRGLHREELRPRAERPLSALIGRGRPSGEPTTRLGGMPSAPMVRQRAEDK